MVLDRSKKQMMYRSLVRKNCRHWQRKYVTFLIEHLSRTGGHLASNLGVVELTIALHRVLHFPGTV